MSKDNICHFDMDGTLCDFAGEMEQELRKLMGPWEGPLDFDALMKENPKWLKARKALIKNQPGFWEGMAPIKAGFDILRIAEDLGFANYILTKGPMSTSAAWTEKKRWCEQYVPELPVSIVQEKSLVYGRVLVDDWPKYFLPWLEARPRGLVIAVAQPWNEGVEHSRLIRYKNDSQLPEIRERMRRVMR